MTKHTPYDGSHPLFRIGLEPLDLKDWIDVDEHLDFYLEDKARLKQLYPGKVFVAEDGTEGAQGEVLEILLPHLLQAFPSSHKREGNLVRAGKQFVDLDVELPPLEIASQLVQEDLLLMRKGADGWRLAAASLNFPSSWTLLEKFSKPLDRIHQSVPDFGPGSRNAGMIFRIFDNLKIDQPVRRLNWSVYPDNELFHDDRQAEHLRKGNLGINAFVRVEHQTLRKLPKSGDLLFTIRIYVNPLRRIMTYPDGPSICRGFIGLLERLDERQLAYKGLTQERQKLVEALREMESGGLA